MTADLLASGEAAFRETAPGRLTIDLGALADNWRALAKLAAPGRTAAVVKGDAYGVGLDKAGPALWSAGARVFFVAHSTEGIAARHILPSEAAIVVLNGLESGADPADYAEHGLKPAIGSEEELERWACAAQALRPGNSLRASSRHRDEAARLRVARRPSRAPWTGTARRAAPNC